MRPLRVAAVTLVLLFSGACTAAATNGWMDDVLANAVSTVEQPDASADANQWGLASQLIATGPETSTATREKAAIIGQARCDTPSGATPNTFTDCVGGTFQGWVNSPTGRAFGIQAEANTVSGNDGTLTGVGSAVMSRGPAAEPPGAVGSKVNFWAGSTGTFPATAAFATAGGGPGWLYGLYLRQYSKAGVYLLPPTAPAPGIWMANGSTWTSAMIIPNNAGIRGRNADATATYALIKLDAAGNVVVGDPNAPLVFAGSSQQKAALTPADTTAPDATCGSDNQRIIANLQARLSQLEARLKSYGLVAR